MSSLGTRLEQKEEEVKQREMEVDIARSEAAIKVSSCKIKSLPHQQQHYLINVHLQILSTPGGCPHGCQGDGGSSRGGGGA